MTVTRVPRIGAVVLAVLVGAACTTSAPGPCDLADCTDPSDASTSDGTVPPDGSNPDAAPPPGCDTPDEPLKNPEKCLVDAFGAFVSPTGDDGNPGTKARPFKTIGKATGGTQARIVVCEGTYAESVEITRNVVVISGIDCAFGKAGGKRRLWLGSPSTG